MKPPVAETPSARHGVKLLDFGLARPELQATQDSLDSLTRSGSVFGTPGYMAPELITGDPGDARSDLFAVGAILFEMLAGRPAFGGRTVIAVVNATLTEQPPALAGSPAVAAVDRVIRRALAKNPDGRPVSTQAMADELNAVRGVDGREPRAMARALTRVVVLPFRVLRPDPEIDFLAFSLPDAITTSLEQQTSPASTGIGRLRRSTYVWNVLGLRVGHKSVTTRSQKVVMVAGGGFEPPTFGL